MHWFYRYRYPSEQETTNSTYSTMFLRLTTDFPSSISRGKTFLCFPNKFLSKCTRAKLNFCKDNCVTRQTFGYSIWKRPQYPFVQSVWLPPEQCFGSVWIPICIRNTDSGYHTNTTINVMFPKKLRRALSGTVRMHFFRLAPSGIQLRYGRYCINLQTGLKQV